MAHRINALMWHIIWNLYGTSQLLKQTIVAHRDNAHDATNIIHIGKN